MAIVVRPMLAEEARTFLEIHARSIRGLAAPHYPSEVIEAWVVPITDDAVRGLLENPDHEIRLLAALDGVPVGLGCLVVQKSELRACYVAPEAARKGVGTAIVREIERIAREHGLEHLHLDASINAEPFYAALGYEVLERGEHVWRSGQRMAAVMMRKDLARCTSTT
jgi:putative acetyltransferase